MYRSVCYTFEGNIDGIIEVVDDGDDVRQVISMAECPGGCAIWGLTCAPSTY